MSPDAVILAAVKFDPDIEPVAIISPDAETLPSPITTSEPLDVIRP